VQVVRGLVARILTAVRLHGGARIIASGGDVSDLMSIGLCGLERCHNDNGQGDGFVNFWTLDEPFAVQCAEKVLRDDFNQTLEWTQYSRLCTEMHSILQSLGSTTSVKGTFLEQILFTRLCSSGFNGHTVTDLPFLHSATISDSARAFWSQVTFNATRIVAHGEPGVADSATFLASDDAVNCVYSPETVMRPDGIIFLNHPNGQRCALVFGACIYSNQVPLDKVRSQRLSTDLNRVYFTKDGKDVNKNAKARWLSWNQKMVGKLPVATIHVHIVLPGTQTACPYGAMAGNDIAIQVDRSNASQLFGDDARIKAMLAMATGTAVAEWH
jgi:hypothetical protein